MRYYLVGIKGTGMAALACLLSDLGNIVSGSDNPFCYFTVDALVNKRIPIFMFNKDNIDGHDIYIIGNAYDESNCEVKEIFEKDYEYYYYHDFIGRILGKEIIAVTGTHGKTTVTSLLAQMTNNTYNYLIGDGTGYGNTDSNNLILEACEYKEHFLAYQPEILIINNIELDHPDYYHSIKQVICSFQKLANQSRKVIINIDDKNAKNIKHDHLITFGFKESDYQIEILNEDLKGYLIQIHDYQAYNSYLYYVPFTGMHMVYNFVAAVVTCKELGLTPFLKELKLPKRRMKEIKYGNSIIIDDYAHHPTEIRCLYDSLHTRYPDYPINVIFEPHTYSRTFKLKKQFVKALSLFNDTYVSRVFTSKREPYDELKEEKVRKIFRSFKLFNKDDLKKISKEKKEIWIFLGAGTIDQYINDLN